MTELSNLTAKIKDIITAYYPLLEKKKSEES
nr:protein SIEVE ELEMENT OCCLUSION B-like isoform X1 [Ipomoea batatas]